MKHMKLIHHKLLTANFDLAEFFPNKEYWHKINVEMEGITADEMANITRLAHILQMARDVIQLPIRITSGYRTLEQNDKCQGAKRSYHLSGCAVDITSKDNKKLFEYLKDDPDCAECIWHVRQGFIHFAIHRDVRDCKHYVLRSFN